MASKSTTQTNAPQTAANGAATKKTPLWMYLGGAALIFIVIIVLVSIFTGGKQEQPKEQVKQSVPTSDSVVGTRPNKAGPPTNPNGNPNQNQNMGGMPTGNNQQNNAATNGQGELRIFVEPATNIEMVQTPSGPVPTTSIEGQKYIEDFSRLKAEAANNGQQGVSNSQALPNNVALQALQEATDAQVRALDDKLNAAYENVDNLQQVIKKQNETIEKMSIQLKSIQPLVKSPNELAKEFFGKNGEKELKSRNNSIKVDSIVGDKAYFTTNEGNTVLVGVGDVIPNTSVKVKKIDAANNTVIVAN